MERFILPDSLFRGILYFVTQTCYISNLGSITVNLMGVAEIELGTSAFHVRLLYPYVYVPSLPPAGVAVGFVLR